MKYYIVDAFTEKVFQGNPAGVFVLEHWIEEELMQKIAFENNLAETAFAVKEGEGYHIRWFTPQNEMDLCGHATLATSFIIHRFVEPELKEILFTSQSGLLKVIIEENLLTLDFPTRMPERIEVDPKVEEILHAKVKEAYLGRDLMLVLEDEVGEEALKNLSPDFMRMASYEMGDGMIVTAKGESCDFVSRCFYPKCGINEDPVTGSAHCHLIPYWAERLGKKTLYAKQLSSRGGDIYCTLEGKRVTMSGHAVLYMEGNVSL